MGTHKRNISVILAPYLYLLFLYALCVNLKFSKMWAFGDLSAFPANINLTKNWTFYVWNEEGLGVLSAKPFNYYFTIILFSFLFGSFTAQKILFLSTLAISFLSFYFFLRKFKINPISSILAALLYAFNPITISDFIGGAMTLMVYAIFPLILFYIIKIIQNQKFNLKDVAILGVLSFFVFNVHTAFWYIIVIFPMLLICKPLLNINIKKIIRPIIPLIITTLILLPNLLGYAGLYGTATSKKVSFASSAAYCYKDSAFYNIVRLAGNTGSAQAKEFLNYNTLNSYTILGYALPLIAFSCLLTTNKHKNDKNRNFLKIFTAISFLASSGLILIIKALPSTVDLNLILATLRNPVKLMYPLSFSLCSTFALGTEQLLTKTNKKHKLNILVSIILVIIILYNYPALDGTLGLAKLRNENYYIEDKYYTIPKILTEIDKNYNDYRILFLPWEYPTLLKIRSEIPNYFGSGTAQEIKWLENAFEVAVAKNSSDRSYLLGLFGVRYVVIDKDFRSYYQGQKWYENLKKSKSLVIYKSHDSYWVTGEPNYFYQIFNSDPNFELVHEAPDFAIFKNKRVITKLYLRPSAVNFTLSYTPISENLLKNPSFQNDTEYWRIYPDSLINITDNFYGNKTVALYGQEKWWTICYQEVPVNENAIYNLKFSVKGYNITDMHAKILWYNITENLTEGNVFSVNYIRLYQMGLKNGEWYDIEETFSAPKTAIRGRIYFLANRLKNFTSTVMYVTNPSFQEVEPIIKNKDEIFSFIRNINYLKINPTKYIVEVNATNPFMLSFAEAYDPLWMAYVNGERIESIPLYSVINGFWINQTGQLEITIEYEPQKWFYYGSIISVTTLLACLTYLTYNWTKNKAIWKQTKRIIAHVRLILHLNRRKKSIQRIKV